MSFEHAAPRAVSSSAAWIAGFLRQMLAVAESDVRKLRHDPAELLTRIVQPMLWLLVFGEVFTHSRAIPTPGMSYLDFMSPGVLAQSVLFAAIFYGISVIWDRDLGVLHKFLVSPVPRSALVLGRALASGVRGLAQAAMVVGLAWVLGVNVRFDPASVAGIGAMVMLGSAVFATFSLIVACVVKTRERFMGIGQVLTMPLFFASNAIYPVDMMPSWLQAIAASNPLTYQVDALRALMIEGAHSTYGLGVDFGVQFLALGVLVAIGSRLYPTIVN